ncbi:MAG: RAD55 family ATPase [Nanobdellota archaeon]
MKFTRKITEKEKKKKSKANHKNKKPPLKRKNSDSSNNNNKKLSRLKKLIDSKNKKSVGKKSSKDLDEAKKILNILTKRYSNTESYLNSLLEKKNNKKFFYQKESEKKDNKEKSDNKKDTNEDDYKVLKEAIKLAQEVVRNQSKQPLQNYNVENQKKNSSIIEKDNESVNEPLSEMANESKEINKEFEEEKKKMEEERRQLEEEKKKMEERKKEMNYNKDIYSKNVNIKSDSKNKKEDKENENKKEKNNEALESKMALLEANLKNMDYESDFDQKKFKNDYVPEEVEFVDEPVGNRAQTGINGLDPVIQGGIRRLTSNLVAGGPGSGKTILSMEYIINGIEKFEENGIYITFEQSREELIELFKNFGKDLEKLEKEKKLLILRYTPEQIGKILESGGGILADSIDSIHAKRIVMDSISDFLMLYKNETEKRKACISLFELFRKFNCTSIFISEQEVDPLKHKSTVLEHQADGVILLYNERVGDIRQRAIEIFKMRGTKHAGRIFPMKITDVGIVILSNHPLKK